MSETKTLLVSAYLDPWITHNMLSYEHWEELNKPPLKVLDESFTKSALIGAMCIGSFIQKVKIDAQWLNCQFYVANKNKIQGAIISSTWMSRVRRLFDPDSKEQPTPKVNSPSSTGSDRKSVV